MDVSSPEYQILRRWIAGGALLAAGAITFFLAPDPERPALSTLRVQAGPGVAGLTLAGRL